MRRLNALLCCGLLLLVGSARADWQTDPVLFFDKFTALGQAFDPAMAELYADAAQIHSVRRYQHGLERDLKMAGDEWKALLREVLPLARKLGDKNNFSNVLITETETGFTVAAHRYSVRQCYIDENYYLKLVHDAGGKLVIMEEYSETQPQHRC